MIDITQLESEINEFHSNIVASRDLLETLRKATQAIQENSESAESNKNELLAEAKSHLDAYQQQCDALSTSADRIVRSGEQQTTSLRDALESSVERLSQANAAAVFETKLAFTEAKDAVCESSETVKSAAEQIRAEGECQNERIREAVAGVAKSVKEANRDVVQSAVEDLKAVQRGYLSELDGVSELFETKSSKLTKQYQSLLARIEETQLDQLYDEVEALKRKLNKKLTLILLGMLIAVILGVLGLVL